MAYINNKTWEICGWNIRDDRIEEDFFEVDENIALTISELNKKGYTTLQCCSGHMFYDLSDFEMESGSSATINDIYYEVPKDCGNKVFDFINDARECYILFAKQDFDTLPDGFIVDKVEVNQYHNEGEVKMLRELTSKVGTLERSAEIIEVNLILYKWAKSLKNIK